MYKNSFIVLIKKNGQPLREVNGKEVYIPFNSEYTIELRNNNYRRAVAKVTVDGTDILGSRELIIPANDSITLERFIVDGNLNNGKKLKFVPLSDGRVSNPSSPENGLIEVEFWLEKLPQNITWTTNYTPDWWKYWNDSGSGVRYRNNTTFTCDSARETKGTTLSANCCNMAFDSVRERSSAGATVEGGNSNQSFSTEYFGEREYPSTIFKVWLRGLDLPITTVDSLHCVNCGKKLKIEYKFCPKCGNNVEIA